ncbi:ATP-binding protein [Bacillus sp. Marseille-P3661]|uniref:ATP-binding protein n=1 Tax=Bacillus sp. Marseille-P3661 TaxID=1936234 RepID=UPI000C864ABD|nr:AAA family ATPase [Bacillus sp. Marseille-P3661]
MKIVSLFIYGFGQFENKSIEMNDNTSFQTIYGKNEAGKSTLMAFIQAILFGFPTRHQSENRYEPKSGNRYGGKLIIKLNDELITIERIAGRATGEVTVYFQNGKTGGEPELSKLLGGYDRSIYQAIFSFGLKGLQAVDSIKADDLGQFLFSAGASGSQAIFELEKKLEKQIDELYKPNGRKPKLNQRIAKLETLHSDLTKWQEKISTYNTVVQKRDNLKVRLHELEIKQNEGEILRKEYEKKQILKPYINERLQLVASLDQLTNYEPFPTNGIERLEKFQLQLAPLSAQNKLIAEKLKEVEDVLKSFQLNNNVAIHESKVRSLNEKFKAIQLQEKELEKIKLSLRYEQDEIDHLLERLGGNYTEETVQKIDISLVIKERLSELIMKKQQLNEQQKFLDEQFKSAKNELELTERSLQKLQHHQSGDNNRDTINHHQPNVTLFLYVMLAAIIMGLSFYIFELIYTIFIVLFVSLLAIFFIRVDHSKRLEPIHVHHNLVDQERIILSQKEKNFENIVERFEMWEQQFRIAEDALEKFCKARGFPLGLSGSQLLDAFQAIEIIKKRIRSKTQLEQEITLLKKEIHGFYIQARELAKLLNIEEDSVELLIKQMLKQIEFVKEQSALKQQYLSKQKELVDQKLNIETQIAYFQEKIKDLYGGAGVQTEEDFRQKGNAQLQYTAIVTNLKAVDAQLHTLTNVKEKHYLKEVELEGLNYNEKLREIEKDRNQYKQEEKELQLEIADLAMQIEHLENGTSYSDLLHRYSLERSIFQDEVKQWATYQVAKDLLQKTKDYYREVRLPQVIKTADGYFSFLTLGAYVKIYPPSEENGFIVERRDGLRFKPDELSQATTEQLYLSVRLALASTFNTPSPLPILIDDSFVNFDKFRTKQVLDLLKEIAQKHQLLFFTCHDHLLMYFNQEELLSLE